MSTVMVREMTPEDIPAVVEVERASFDAPWEPSVFESELAAPDRHYVVGEEGGRVVAYGGSMVVDGDAHIMTIAVDPRRRRTGIGTRLMLRLVETAIAAGAEHLTLEVRPSNLDARRLYGRFGFRPVGLRPRYYRDEDALVMWAIDVTDFDYSTRLDLIRSALS